MPENMVLRFIAIFVMRSSVLDNDLRLAKFNIDIMLWYDGARQTTVYS